MDLIELIKTFGLPVALVIIFIARDIWRERKQEARFSGLEQFCRNDLLQISKESTKAVEEGTEVIRQNTEVLSQCKERLKANA